MTPAQRKRLEDFLETNTAKFGSNLEHGECIRAVLAELDATRQALAELNEYGDPGLGLSCGACRETEHDEHKDWCPVARMFPGFDPGTPAKRLLSK